MVKPAIILKSVEVAVCGSWIAWGSAADWPFVSARCSLIRCGCSPNTCQSPSRFVGIWLSLSGSLFGLATFITCLWCSGPLRFFRTRPKAHKKRGRVDRGRGNALRVRQRNGLARLCAGLFIVRRSAICVFRTGNVAHHLAPEHECSGDKTRPQRHSLGGDRLFLEKAKFF